MNRLAWVNLSASKTIVQIHAARTRKGLELACLFVIIFSVWPVHISQAKTDSAYDLIASVNQLRKANGLPAYQINGSLMAAAQSHSEYQASIGSITHSGAGGSTAKSRAIAAGFGGGATVYVSENIAGGNGMTYQKAVQLWQGDNLHLNTMLGGNYTDVGAGVAVSGGQVYFTLDVGYVAGAPGSGAPASTNNPAIPAQATAVPVQPMITATPAPDGSVTHTVLSGQTLWIIAVIYKVSLPEILQLNGFTNSTLIFPGDQILIKSANEPGSPTAEETTQPATLTPTPRPTRTASPTPTRGQSTSMAMPEMVALPPPGIKPATTNSLMEDPALLLIGAMVIGGTVLIILGSLLKKP